MRTDLNIPELYELRAMYDGQVRGIIARALEQGFDLSNPDYGFGLKLGIHPQTFEDTLDCYDLLECMQQADLAGDLEFYFWCERFLRIQYIDWYLEDSREIVYDGKHWN